MLFARQINAGHSYLLIHNILTYAAFIYIFSGIVPGWNTLTRITPATLLFLPIIGWVLYFLVKLVLSLGVGLVMLPIRTVRNIMVLAN